MGDGAGVPAVACVGAAVGNGVDIGVGGGAGVRVVARVGGDGVDVGVGGEVELEQATTTTTATAANTAPSLTVLTFEIISRMIPERPAC